jgi:enterobacterial common antigen flippase
MTTHNKFRSVLRATAILGSSSLINILVGMVSTKFSAVVIGPRGTGMMDLLQNLVALATLIAALGAGTALVREGAYALAHEDHGAFAALRRAVWLLFWTAGGLTAACMVIFRAPLAHAMLGSARQQDFVSLAALMLLFGLADAVQRAILNAYQRVGVLAKTAILQCVIGVPFSLAAIWFGREKGIGYALLFPTIIGWGISRGYLWHVERSMPRAPMDATATSAWKVLCFGVPYTLSMFLGNGIQSCLPLLVLHMLGKESVGFFDAAITISTRYLAFLTNSMGQDYYPRLSAVADRPADMTQMVNQQLRLVLLVLIPLVLALLALSPLLVPLLFSPQFSPAVKVLEWQLVSDLFKMTSWTLGVVILARSNSKALLMTETVGGVVTLIAAVVAVRWIGLEGIGVAFLVGYAIHCAFVWWMVRRDIGFRWTRENKQLLAAGLAAALTIRLLPYLGLAVARTGLALLMAVGAGAFSAWTIHREWHSTKPVAVALAE